MSRSPRFRFVLLCLPLLAFALICALPHVSVRLSLILHGHPFARVIPKERLNVFEFVPTDNLRSRAIVFSERRAIGWIYQPTSGFPRFVPFSATPNFMDVGGFDPVFGYIFLLLWVDKWWLIGAYALLFGSWFA